MILDSFKLDGRVALVTGAARGLGQGCAVALAEAGANIAALDYLEVEETGAMITALGRRFSGIQCDLRTATPGDFEKLVAQIESEMGRLDILINNAGIIRRAPVLEFGEVDWDEVLQINLKALYFLSQAAAKAMVERGEGKIINIASMNAYRPLTNIAAYSAAKAAIVNFTQWLAVYMAQRHSTNIRVNAIAPGFFLTQQNRFLLIDEKTGEVYVKRGYERLIGSRTIHGTSVDWLSRRGSSKQELSLTELLRRAF